MKKRDLRFFKFHGQHALLTKGFNFKEVQYSFKPHKDAARESRTASSG
jgi:hypothetical protein